MSRLDDKSGRLFLFVYIYTRKSCISALQDVINSIALENEFIQKNFFQREEGDFGQRIREI
ncbi:hypothetical protein [Salinimicrobium sp. GXAS 041]|uniref:hypothetical protein n=1 Tax=Salinimicrobium sp. GXAS 041 TaxID=3400806 RepID=UPI003C73D22D